MALERRRNGTLQHDCDKFTAQRDPHPGAIREALSLFIGNAAQTVELETKVELPAPVRKAVDRSKPERARAQEAEAANATKEAVKAALKAGLSTRDAGALLGLTRQRVQQVASGG